ncbi:MAG: carbonic anhydrase family protein [Cytophagaceae bacterium]
MKSLTKEEQTLITPSRALQKLKNGNKRFMENLMVNRNLLQQVNETSEGQFPFAAILSCIDSRTSAELIFDQGLGDIFSIRIAGNILNKDILASMEFACKVAGSKLVLVLGHTKCGAIAGACNNVQMGNLTSLLEKVKPAIKMEGETSQQKENDSEYVNHVTVNNIFLVAKEIKERSEILKEMAENGEIRIVGGLYDVETGKVDFFEEEEIEDFFSKDDPS